jgi:hypothetical protein
MKRIIHDGVDHYHARCGECGCGFTYEREDVGHNYVTGGDYTSCPHCGHPVRHFGAPLIPHNSLFATLRAPA